MSSQMRQATLRAQANRQNALRNAGQRVTAVNRLASSPTRGSQSNQLSAAGQAALANHEKEKAEKAKAAAMKKLRKIEEEEDDVEPSDVARGKGKMRRIK